MEAGRQPFDRLREEAGQAVFLSGHFFRRFFRNDLVDFEDQMKERLIAVLAGLAVIMAWSTELLLSKYLFLPDANRSWQEKNYIFTLMMIIFGMVTLIEWDVLFLDRKDYQNLMPLPVRVRTLFGAKLASFLFFVGLFSTAMTSLSAILFSIYLAEWKSTSLLYAARYVLAHVISAFSANLFVFLACVFLQFLLMAVLPFRLYKRVSLFIRAGILAVFVFLFFAFLVQPGILDQSFQSLETLKAAGDRDLLRFPPLWFVGLYETILGNPDPLFRPLAGMAGWAMVFSLAAFLAGSGLSYVRHLRKTSEIKKNHKGLLRPWQALAGGLRTLVLGNPEGRAVYPFFSATMRSSPKHRMTLAYYVAIASAFIVLFIVADRQGFQDLSISNRNLLALPVFLAVVLLAGVRSLVIVPISPEANWIFRVTETPHRKRYLDGLRKAVLIRLLLPMVLVVFIAHAFLWNWADSLRHALFILAVSSLVMEAFFLRFRKIPFACAYLPGKTKLFLPAIIFILAFALFLQALAVLESSLLAGSPGGFFVFLAAAASGLAILEIVNSRFLKRTPLIYEEEPEPALVGFPDIR